VLAAVLVAAAAAVVAVAPASAPNAAKAKSINAQVTLAQLTQSGNTSKDAGEYVGTPGRRSAVLQRVVQTGQTATANGTVFTRVGKWKYRADVTVTPQPGGSLGFTGRAKITGGTGRYSDAHGHFTFTGSAPRNSNVATFQVTGTIKF
jgi:hypothetical protein